MANNRILKFNIIAGKAPVGLENKDKFWEQALNQAERVYEEAKEMLEAAKNKDLLETLDGFCDVYYTNDFMEFLLIEAGVQTYQAKDQVCLNNDSKYTMSKELAQESLKLYTEPCNVHCVEYRGTFYYTVKRDSDDKVMKLKGHLEPNIKSSIPEGTWKELM